MEKSRKYRKFEKRQERMPEKTQKLSVTVLRLTLSFFAAFIWKWHLNGAVQAVAAELRHMKRETLLFPANVSFFELAELLEHRVHLLRISVSVELLLAVLAGIGLYALLCRGKGRIAAVFLFLIPTGFALLQGAVPPERSCYLMMFAAGCYFAAGGSAGRITGGSAGSTVGRTAGSTAGGSVLTQAAAAACILGAVLLIASMASQAVERYKEEEGGFYQEARGKIKTEYVSAVQNYVTEIKESWRQGKEDKKEGENAEEKPENKPESEQEKSAERERNLTETEREETEAAELLTNEYAEQNATDAEQNVTDTKQNVTGAGRSTAGNVASAAYFRPNEQTELTLELDRKPEETVYYAQGYGYVYENSTWSGKGEETKGDEAYKQYPAELKQLKALCEKEQKQNSNMTLADVSRFISREFQENTVYDFEPGATPDGKDAAEYFLFENQKGFCVHFATTAVLMYRMCGYSARYAYGYAVPADAFERSQDGIYVANVTSGMGHAWCEVYENGWSVKEHTLAYTGVRPETGQPAVAEGGKNWKPSAAGWLLLFGKIGGALGIAALSAVLLRRGLLAVRRKNRYRRMYELRKSAGVQRTYLSICGEYKVQEETLLRQETMERIKVQLPEEIREEFEELYRLVMESLFYERRATKAETKRAVKLYDTICLHRKNEAADTTG